MNKKGQNLVEIVIMFSIIVTGAIVALTLLGNNVGDLYNLAVNKVANFKPFGEPAQPAKAAIATETSGGVMELPQGGSLGGTSDAPVKQCNAGMCSIDFGDFVLTGIPENLGTFVETSGGAGGVDQLANLLTQIAEQQEVSDPDGSQEYLKLANLVHLQADILRHVENKVKSGATAIEFQDFYMGQTLQSTGYNVPSALGSVLSGLDINQTVFSTQYELGYARNKKVNDPASFTSLANQHPAYAIVDQYDKIISNPKYSESLKALTQEIYLNIADLSFNSKGQISATAASVNSSTEGTANTNMAISGSGGVSASASTSSGSGVVSTSGSVSSVDMSSVGNATGGSANTAGGSGNVPQYDPITGTVVNNVTFNSSTLDSILHPQYSLKDDINGALICAAGQNIDTSTSCH